MRSYSNDILVNEDIEGYSNVKFSTVEIRKVKIS